MHQQDNLFVSPGLAACVRMACAKALAKNGVIQPAGRYDLLARHWSGARAEAEKVRDKKGTIL
jgi:hypothetical protein